MSIIPTPVVPQLVDTNSKTMKRSNEYTHLLVIDFEATCDQPQTNLLHQEIIEFPIVIIDLTKTDEDVESHKIVPTISSREFHRYVKPVVHPILSKFCNELTGIEQEWIDRAKDWKSVWIESLDWIKNWEEDEKKISGVEVNWAIVTCGDWDIQSMLPRQMALTFTAENQHPIPLNFQQWINVKKLFTGFYKTKSSGMTGMLRSLKLPLEGRHHSGIDDSRNIARIVKRMLEDGCVFEITGRL